MERTMKVGDIVECLDYGAALILAPCDVPQGVVEEDLVEFLADPEDWPTESGWTVQLLEDDNRILSVHEHNLESLTDF
jgi:hypothetical protein